MRRVIAKRIDPPTVQGDMQRRETRRIRGPPGAAGSSTASPEVRLRCLQRGDHGYFQRHFSTKTLPSHQVSERYQTTGCGQPDSGSNQVS